MICRPSGHHQLSLITPRKQLPSGACCGRIRLSFADSLPKGSPVACSRGRAPSLSYKNYGPPNEAGSVAASQLVWKTWPCCAAAVLMRKINVDWSRGAGGCGNNPDMSDPEMSSCQQPRGAETRAQDVRRKCKGIVSAVQRQDVRLGPSLPQLCNQTFR